MTNTKQSIRPIIHTIGSQEHASKEERFQNEVLRPILKMQHDLIIAFFDHYTTRMKLDFTLLTGFKKKEMIANAFARDNQFKTELRGIIVGQFTVNEYQTYLPMSSSLNKRIGNMLQERIASTI
ncbi:MAG: glyoxalase [Crocinitomicaceae bacterium]|nr:glyoxalase [Crocinitomicaceae bacterium]